MEYYNAINTGRYARLFGLVNGHHWLAHVLDRLIYRCQNSKLVKGKPTITESLADLSDFIGEASVSMFRKHGQHLEKLGLIAWKTHYTSYGKQTFISLTSKLTQALNQQLEYEAIARLKREGILPTADTQEEKKQGEVPCFLQAENDYRYQAISQLMKKANGRHTFFYQHVLNQLMIQAQHQAKEENTPLEMTYIAINQAKLADTLRLPVRSLQRYLQALEKQGLLKKVKKKVSRSRVETSYRVALIVWEATRKANAEMKKNQARHRQKPLSESSENTSTNDTSYLPEQPSEALGYRPNPSGIFGGFKRGIFGGCNINTNKTSYINQKHSTKSVIQCRSTIGNVLLKNTIVFNYKSTQPILGYWQYTPSSITHINLNEVVGEKRSTKQAFVQNLPLDTNMSPEVILNKRQHAYLSAVLQNLETQHGCYFSDPIGLRDEIIFSLKAIGHVFIGKTSFQHRLNLIAKLLRERRWTTPHGYERYDAKGRAQKAKREAREAAWAAKKQEEQEQQERGRAAKVVALNQVLPANTSLPRAALPAAVTDHLDEMKRLAARAQAPDCSPEARAAIEQLMHRHRSVIQELIAAHECTSSREAAVG